MYAKVQLVQILQSRKLLEAEIANFGGLQIQLLECRGAGECSQLRVADTLPGERHFAQFAAREHGLAAQRRDPIGQGLVAASARPRRLGAGSRGGGAHEFDFAGRNRRLQGLNAARGDATVPQVHRAQLMQRPEPGEAGVGDTAPIEIQLAQMRHAGEDGDTFVRDGRTQEDELAQLFQVFQVSDAAVGHLHAVEIQLFQFGESGEVLESFVGDAGVAQVEAAEIAHVLQPGHGIVAEGGIAHVERFQADERVETAFVDFALFAAKLLQIGQAAEGGEAGIGDVEIGKEVEGELKPLQILHPRDHLQFRIALQFAARAGSEGRTWKVEFADVLHAVQVLQVLRFQHGSREIDTGEADRSGGQLGQQRDGLAAAVDHHAPAFAYHPFGGLAVGRGKGRECGNPYQEK